MKVNEVSNVLNAFAPLWMAEEWDNVGLLIGRRDAEVHRVMTCLTVTPATAREAVNENVDLLITHHPMPFAAVKQITDLSVVGSILLDLIESRVAVYSPHTAFDSASAGINQQLADALRLTDIQPLRPFEEVEAATLGAGRFGRNPEGTTAEDVARSIKEFLAIDHVRMVGDPARRVNASALACGSAGEFLGQAREFGCDLMITGETSFHTCLEAEASDVVLVLTGHYASERFAVEALAQHLSETLKGVEVWPSRDEANPWRVV